MKSGDAEVAALVAAVDGDWRFEIELGEVLGRFRRRRDAEIRDREAADLLPHIGADAVAERQGCDRVTVYRRAKRATRRAVVAFRPPLATSI